MASAAAFSVVAFAGGVVAFALTAGVVLVFLQIIILSVIPVVSVAIVCSVVSTCAFIALLLVDSIRSSRDDMSILPLWLVREYLHIGPRMIVEGFRRGARAARLANANLDECAEVLAFLASRNTGLSRAEFIRAFPGLSWTRLTSQLRLLDGVLVLGRDASRITLTTLFRLQLRQRLQPPPAPPLPEDEAEPVSIEGPEALSPHQILGVGPGASLSEIKAAYRHRVKECHPDRFAGLDENSLRLAEEWTKALNSAYFSLVRQTEQRTGN